MDGFGFSDVRWITVCMKVLLVVRDKIFGIKNKI